MHRVTFKSLIHAAGAIGRIVHPISAHLKEIFLKVLLFGCALGVWECLTLLGLRGAKFPTPLAVGGALIDTISSGELFADVIASVSRILVGFFIAVLMGTLLGVGLGYFKRLAKYGVFFIEMFRPIPPIAWIPLAILWFNIGNRPAYFIVFLGVFFPIFSSAFTAVRSVESLYVDAAKSLGADTKILTTDVLIPTALPHLLSGLRAGLGVGWMCVVTAELVGAQSGLGYMIQLNRTMLQTDYVVAGMVIIGLVGLCMNWLMAGLQSLLTPWTRVRSI